MNIPILNIGKVLIISIQVDLSDENVLMLQQKLLQEIKRKEASGVVIDLAAMDVVDSFMCRVFSDTAKMAYLIGAQVVFTGIQPAVAIALTELGVSKNEILTMLNLERGLSYLVKKIKEGERK